jgi:hypothetical protein
MKIFKTLSPEVVKDCQQFFPFDGVNDQSANRKWRFLGKFISAENSISNIFVHAANTDLCTYLLPLLWLLTAAKRTN